MTARSERIMQGVASFMKASAQRLRAVNVPSATALLYDRTYRPTRKSMPGRQQSDLRGSVRAAVIVYFGHFGRAAGTEPVH